MPYHKVIHSILLPLLSGFFDSAEGKLSFELGSLSEPELTLI